MSTAPLVRDPSTSRLLDDGYDLAIQGGHLIVRKVPYVTPSGAVAYGCLAYPITVSGDRINDDSGDHRIWFVGEQPCDEHGRVLPAASAQVRPITKNLAAEYMLSSKPPSGYADQYAKVTSYARILSHPAQAIDPAVTATLGAGWDEVEDGLPFVYRDTASSRAGLAELNSKFQGHKIAIVGLGGTGSYILDQVAKTWVDAIDLFDGDFLDNHNAFRAPGAADIEELRSRPNKAEYFAALYSHMHIGITAHPVDLDEENFSLLDGATFVFLAAADAESLPAVMAWLSGRGVPFIDVGMGIEETDGRLSGLLRVTTHFPEDHVRPPRPPAVARGGVDDYDRNIQTADLNALNAILAVIAWKKHLGYYADHTAAVETLYKVFTGEIRNVEAG
ncbi:ThiF family adenylyltransferase [Catellatospora tritici]|uniref:ThiF family adenylyltransferase n=1 Tax=Catellatospora tritici TaxID=2851566 RepID=UPI001C2D7938|nr:ThiF family adenylyltransferase [Catellatospora tritici]MBV1854539.1 ThiF family adenylyltransferase [Catellatospora tritici]